MTDAAAAIPDNLRDLLENPNYGSLGTVRPDGTVQVNPMWFELEGDRLLFTHTTARQKFRNLQANPSMSLSVFDPANPFRYIEVRGRLVDVTADPEGEFYVRLGKRYGNAGQEAPPDKADRVVLAMSIEHVGHH
jgi:PPOX class probable F420-dependent enzyme